MKDEELKKVALDFRRGLIGKRSSKDMCFMVCAPLEGFLRCSGVDVRLIEGNVGRTNHFWLELKDGRILDPTADQFGLEPIYLGEKPRRWKYA